MIRAPRQASAIKSASAVLLLACACLLLIAIPARAASKSKVEVKFTNESVQAYEQQLASDQIAVAKFSPAKHTMRLTLKNGQHVHVVYPTHDEPKLRAALKARGVSLPAVAKPKISHKRRYIVGALIVVVLIVIVVGVVFLIRRKRSDEDY